MMNAEQCWNAVCARDASKDGTFFFGVRTTGVYCRPSCRARLPLRENVRFYASADDAERDGLRACLRCRPRATEVDPYAQRVREVCRHIEAHADEPLKLADLAARAGLSPFHFQRSFKAIVGVTPRAYVEAVRVERLKSALKASKDVTSALYDAGYGSPSRLHALADTRLGMTPKQYRSGGANVTISYACVHTALGMMMLGATDRGLCFVQFDDSEAALLQRLQREYPAARVEPMRTPYDPQFDRWIASLQRHLAGTQPHLDLPLDIRATAFQLRVWSHLQSIPYGEVRSYGEIAASLGNPKGARAVARACASNVAAIVIPCHRVIRNSGELGGYRWGLARKRTLLDTERT